MLSQIEKDIIKTEREADGLGLQKEPFRFYSPEERALIKRDKKKKKISK